PSTPPRRRKGRVQLQPWPDLLSLSSGGLQGLQAGNNVVVLRLRAEAIRAIRARVALVALGALRAVLAVSTSGATRPIRARVTLVALRALRSLSRTSRLNPVQLSRRNRRTPSLPVLPLIRLKRHQTSPFIGKTELPGKLDAPGVSLPPQRPRRRPNQSERVQVSNTPAVNNLSAESNLVVALQVAVTIRVTVSDVLQADGILNAPADGREVTHDSREIVVLLGNVLCGHSARDSNRMPVQLGHARETNVRVNPDAFLGAGGAERLQEPGIGRDTRGDLTGLQERRVSGLKNL